MKSLAILACITLTGCASAMRDHWVHNAHDTCAAAGFRDGTNQMADCVARGVRQSQANFSESMRQLSEQLQQIDAQRRASMPIVTNCVQNGNVVSCVQSR